jgi:hypothetical protein
VEVDGPQFLASVEFTPQQIGNAVVQWEGKNKLRGLKSVFACPGSGVIQVQVNGNSEQIAQKWNQYFSSVNEEIRDCVKVGMDLSQLKYQVLADPAVTLTSPEDLLLKPIYEKCESFAKQNQPRKGAPCTLASQNNLKTICDGVYAERQPDGRLKTISRTAAIQLQFEGKPWTVGVLENLAVRTARLKQESDDKAKQAEELAAKKEADEKERLFKLSPEYKKQQAALEIKRIADEKDAARKQAEAERVRIAEEKQATIKAQKEKEAQEREAKLKLQRDKAVADSQRNLPPIKGFSGAMEAAIQIIENNPRIYNQMSSVNPNNVAMCAAAGTFSSAEIITNIKSYNDNEVKVQAFMVALMTKSYSRLNSAGILPEGSLKPYLNILKQEGAAGFNKMFPVCDKITASILPLINSEFSNYIMRPLIK